MFGFGQREERELARVLVPTVAYHYEKYGNCDEDDFLSRIVLEVPTGHFSIAGKSAQVAPPELPHFQLLIGPSVFGSGLCKREVSVFGRGAYVGFGMVANGPRSEWLCYAGGDLVKASSKAKNLVRELPANHAIEAASRL